ncbi:MAG: PA0069 family radical SAM protein [Siculibacillus sp.]|nr:PA0069 family radical SAM protein [Siculibacillus sp.]
MTRRALARTRSAEPLSTADDGERPARDIAADRVAASEAGFAAAARDDGAVVLDARIEAERRRGRGAASNPSGRHETESRIAFDDGWGTLDDLPPFTTEVTIEKPKTILTRNTSPDVPFDRSINPYRGCEHGCSYCFARPTHAWMGLSPGLDFESRLFVKPDAARLLERELGAAGYVCRPVAIGTNTDPYQPVERRFRLMREILEVLDRCGHPVTIVTKSALVLRDVDILGRMGERGLAKVALSVTSLDRRLSRSMEPRAATPEKRLAAVRGLAEAGVPVGVMVAPVIPALNDTEIERILEAAAAAGAREAGYILLRLPLEVSEIFKEWLLEHHPDRYRHVLSLLRAMREGKDYDAAWGRRMRGSGPYATTMRKRFEAATRRLGLEGGRDVAGLRTDLFVPPLGDGRQLSLF